LSASMAALVADSVAGRRFLVILLAATACLALAMSVAGIYGVVSYTTSRRTREIGIRMAVGATPGRVFGLIFRQGFAAVAAGLAVGSCAAMALSGVLRSSLTGFETGPRGYMGMAFVLVALAAGAACWIPSRRATRMDPAESLRQE
ncbi:MAG: FtsX-like permease family protein, partial [Acidobacteriota bacterium]|nr:FtsX-like permease family protein [Acidobacteriota bacterium]